MIVQINALHCDWSHIRWLHGLGISQDQTGRNIMTNLNTQANRDVILNRIEKDGVNLKEFSKDQKIKIIKTYAAVCLRDGEI